MIFILILLLPVFCHAQALSAPGTNGNYVSVSSLHSAFVEGDPHMTLMGWFKTTDTSADLFTWQDTAAPNYGVVLSVGVVVANRLEFLCNSTNSSGVWTSFSAASIITNGVWTHIAVAWDGATLFFYKNGVFVESVARAGGFSLHTNQARLFYSNFDGFRPYAGVSQDFRFYSATLSADDIYEIYLANGRDKPNLSTLGLHVWGDFSNLGNIPTGTALRDLSRYQHAVNTSGTITSVEGIISPPRYGAY